MFLLILLHVITAKPQVSKESKNSMSINCDVICPDVIKTVSTNRRIPALEYLGCGYDILFGSPFGDPGTLVDPGYREPIISYSIVQRKSNTRKGVFAKINGAWIRPLVACKRSNKTDIVKSIKEYKAIAEIDSDISASAIDDSAKFSLSTNYSKAKDTLKSRGNDILIDRSYCFLLEAGLPIHSNWKLRKSFILAARKLKPGFREAARNCTILQYSMNPNSPHCTTVKPWIDLFEQFGTHFSYNIKIGGKVTSVTRENSESYKKDKGKGASLGLSVSNKGINADASFTFGNSKEKGKNISSNYTNILGGLPVGNINNEADYIKWIKSVYKNPMPIRSQFAPISKLFKSKGLKESYDEAIRFYFALSL